MEIRLDRALQSKVARRVATLFVLCSVVPLVGLALLTTAQTTRELETRARERLRYDAKTAALDALGRLQLQAQTLQMLGSSLAGSSLSMDAARARIEDLLVPTPDALSYLPDVGPRMDFAGPVALPALTVSEQAHLLSAGTLLVEGHDESGRVRDVLIVKVAAGAVMMAVNFEATFGLDGWDLLPPGSMLCAHRRGRLIACSPGVEGNVRTAVAALAGDVDLTLPATTGPLIVRSWSLPLKGSFGAEPIVVVMLRPESLVQQPVAAFLWNFWAVLALSVCLVVWLSTSQVRRQMRPLVALLEGTRRLAQREFEAPVRITSGDEFEELGKAFNRLSADLSRQFADLEAFSLGTLETLGRTIDAKSPWTGGHSGRVTDLAVDLAVEMRLPEQVVTDLRYGGQVHDIGKLATPAGILDKPARLTPEEEAIMRQHPTQGVHILEPIPAFSRLLPIVEQHHERWDGRGYPHGLAGDAIALPARVLAVADVFDAMRSDRPYRRGLPVPHVIRAIRRGAGSHFDPAVIEAFVRLMARRHAADLLQDGPSERVAPHDEEALDLDALSQAAGAA